MRDAQRQSTVDIFLCVLITIAIIAVDRITKIFFSGLLNFGESIPVIDHIFHFTLVHNTGIAFGLFKDQGFVFIIIPIIAIILLIFNIYYYRQNNSFLNRSYIIAFSLILGGAIGNLIDRMTYGYVVDFLDFRIWPVFNIADSAITIGAIVIGWKCIQLSGKK
jgi:signal peptidase II